MKGAVIQWLIIQQIFIQAILNNISQQAQNQYLVNQIKPCAIPAYITCSPYESAFIGDSRCGYRCNS